MQRNAAKTKHAAIRKHSPPIRLFPVLSGSSPIAFRRRSRNPKIRRKRENSIDAIAPILAVIPHKVPISRRMIPHPMLLQPFSRSGSTGFTLSEPVDGSGLFFAPNPRNISQIHPNTAAQYNVLIISFFFSLSMRSFPLFLLKFRNNFDTEPALAQDVCR